MASYGWVFEDGRSVAGPLVLLYFMAFTMFGAFIATSALMTDFYPEMPRTAPAPANWVRCWFVAAAVAVTCSILKKIGTGWLGVIVAVIWVAFLPLLGVVWWKGVGWRREKSEKLERKKLVKEAENLESGGVVSSEWKVERKEGEGVDGEMKTV